ncbi:hypothetical protein DFH08DRAFT_1080451 [Mycena albidolilacea]|uniref:Uncharacterized protein n=1 Tax=Mycena albidolilacea TaxID=1033008 RepID=A0AAD7EQP8_9AGAR|nr:hypothetical protein DFH08DRAFT_1080451 [Mycena albidolilacea]
MITKGSSVAILLSLCVQASAQTLYTVSAGTLFDPGGTTNAEVETAIPGFFVTDQVHSSSLARPQTVEVIPVTETFVEDASGWRMSGTAPDGSVAATCTFGPSAQGACVKSLTIVVTLSGSVVPFSTLAVGTPASTSASGSSTPTSPPSVAWRNSALFYYGPALLAILFRFA